ncbi:hypothetical protein CFP56_032506 [Quercus suber]|uniref:Uncharacterized protein n=1 Tax=Quercus suber TaxID=58331 RepID=A0AAW0JGR5_QUESU
MISDQEITCSHQTQGTKDYNHIQVEEIRSRIDSADFNEFHPPYDNKVRGYRFSQWTNLSG